MYHLFQGYRVLTHSHMLCHASKQLPRAQMFSQRAVSRSAGLLHCDEMFFDEEPEAGTISQH